MPACALVVTPESINLYRACARIIYEQMGQRAGDRHASLLTLDYAALRKAGELLTKHTTRFCGNVDIALWVECSSSVDDAMAFLVVFAPTVPLLDGYPFDQIVEGLPPGLRDAIRSAQAGNPKKKKPKKKTNSKKSTSKKSTSKPAGRKPPKRTGAAAAEKPAAAGRDAGAPPALKLMGEAVAASKVIDQLAKDLPVGQSFTVGEVLAKTDDSRATVLRCCKAHPLFVSKGKGRGAHWERVAS